MLNKKVISLAATLIFGGLTGCGTNNEAMDMRYNDNFQPVGFYTNEENNEDRKYTGMGRNVDIDYNRELIGRNVNYDYNDGTRNTTNNGNLNTRNNGNMFDQVDARDTGEATPQYDGGDINDRGDLNYHGQLNSTLNSYPTRSYDDKFDNRLARRMENRIERIENIGNTHVIIDGDRMLVAVDNNEDGNEQNLEREIRTITDRMAPGKTIEVVTDQGTVDRVQIISDELNNGGTIDEFQSDIRGIFDNIGDAVQRPFQNNR